MFVALKKFNALYPAGYILVISGMLQGSILVFYYDDVSSVVHCSTIKQRRIIQYNILVLPVAGL